MQKLKVVAAIFGLGLGFAAAAPAAHATNFSLITEKEGEIDVGLGCLDPNQCMTINGMTITSLDQDPNDDFGASRLFIDQKGTTNNYANEVIFGVGDLGTTELNDEFRLRSVAYDNNGNALEDNGQLEVGRYLVEFAEAIDVDLSFFDTEDEGTGIVQVNGMEYTGGEVQAGIDGNYQTVSLTNVTSFVMQVGNYTAFNGVGDGVTISAFKTSKQFAVADVPEPTTTLSLGALAVAGMFGVKKRKNLKK